MKAKKIILKYIVMPLVILLTVLAFVFFFVGEALIKTTVTKVASSTLGVPVTIKDLDLSLLRGKVVIKGLVVNNPSGYANETLLELGQCEVDIDIWSLMSDEIKIETIKVDGTKVTMEQKGLTNNLKEILDKLPKEEGKTEPKAEPKAEGKGKNLIITHLEITNTNVRVKLLPIPGKSDTISMRLDPIVMENLGADQKLQIGTLVGKVLVAMGSGITKQGIGLLPDDMVNGIGSAIGQTAELGKAAVDGGIKALEGTKDAGKNIVDGVKGLFGGKKE